MELKSINETKLASQTLSTRVALKTSVESQNQSTAGGLNDYLEISRNRPENVLEYSTRNNLITIANLAQEGLNSSVKAVKGLVSVLGTGSENVSKQLAKTANSLKESYSLSTASDGFNPLSGEPIIINSNNQISTLRFPTDVKEAFGLTRTPPPTEYDLSFLQERLEAFENQSKDVLSAIYNAATSAEVADQNIQALSSTSEDIDSSISLAFEAGLAILSQPAAAIDAAGNIDRSSLKGLF